MRDLIDVEEFLYQMKKKHIICFGMGKAFKEFCRAMSWYHVEEYIDCIVDNNALLWGEIKNCNNKRIKCTSPLEIPIAGKRCFCIVICAKDKDVIRSQIEQILGRHTLLIYHYEDIIISVSKYRADKNIYIKHVGKYSERQIPKQIHYTWFGRKELPALCKKCIKSWSHFCPDYEIILWNENNYDVYKHPYIKAAYKAKKWAFVSDYARLDIIYNLGGIYLDTDVELLRGLDDLCYDVGFAGFELGGRVATGLGFGARPQLNIIKIMRDEYNQKEFINFHTNDERIRLHVEACPEIQTKTLMRYGLKRDEFIKQYIGDFVVHPVPVLTGAVGDNTYDNGYIYARHHYTYLWKTV